MDIINIMAKNANINQWNQTLEQVVDTIIKDVTKEIMELKKI